MRRSDNWTSFDHVGASAKYSIPIISSECPQHYKIDFFAEYWLPGYPSHLLRQGKITLAVKGKDSTSPTISWVRIAGDNVIKVKVYDGSAIKSVKAILINTDVAKKLVEIELNDEGGWEEGDRTQGDNVFSKKIPQQQFGHYRLEIEAIDSFGNKTREEATAKYIVY